MTYAQLVSRLVNDAAFRSAMAEDPSAALSKAGVQPTPEMVSALKAVDYGCLKRVAKAFGSDDCDDGFWTS